MRLPFTIYSIFWIVLFCIGCEKSPQTLFQKVLSRKTNIDFNNKIQESDSLNMLEYANFYTGAGVAVGDINNDGLDDIFLGGNMVSSKLYLNVGGLVFKDITKIAGVNTHRWITGVSMADVNADGFLDIYLSVSGKDHPRRRKNLLFINQQDITFLESAASYGLDDPGPSTHSVFLDYDSDGDLDLFLAQNDVNDATRVNYLSYVRPYPEALGTDKLYRNNGDGTFTNVSRASGIEFLGYSLGVVVGDLNQDHLDDIFVTSDFQPNDLIYINQGDGTFKEMAQDFLRHSSYSGMGVDIGDVNGDALPDLLVLDMLAEENERQKTLMDWPAYDRYLMSQDLGYIPSYTRNTLQIHNGRDFSEVGQLAGIAQTDWSWSALFGDFDLDGDRDIMITNGFLKDLGDLDYITYQNNASSERSREEILQSIINQTGVPLQNYLYENKGNLQFEDQSKAWGFTEKTFAHGAAISDLDNDGDLDLVINNSNQEASIYENTSNLISENRYIKIKLTGASTNPFGIGTKVWIYSRGQVQYYQHYPYRGYQSTSSHMIHFGMDSVFTVDSIRVRWPGGRWQQLNNIPTNQVLRLKEFDARDQINAAGNTEEPLFTKINLVEMGIDFEHQENLKSDFKVQPLLPHMHSQNGPGIAVGDINNDGLDDLYIGGATGQSGQLFTQRPDQSFIQMPFSTSSNYEDMGAVLADLDNDMDLDLLISSGGTGHPEGSQQYADRLYRNDGLGTFTRDEQFPGDSVSSSVVTLADYDRDGDLDLFIGGRVSPGQYPQIPRSRLLINQTNQGLPGKFEQAPEFDPYIGMVSAALWTDYNNDQWVDLIVVGEWMPLTIFENDQGHLRKIESPTLELSLGWWNSLMSGDFDRDGDMDYVAGNLGLNSWYTCSASEPLTLYAKDFDQNGQVDPVLCMYIEGEPHAPYFRSQLINQLPELKQQFTTYRDYAQANFFKLFPVWELKDASKYQAHTFETSYFENLGNGAFRMVSLPRAVQVAPTFGMAVYDVNQDSNLDILLIGNSYGNDAFVGQYDAHNGSVLLGDGHGAFQVGSPDLGFRADRNTRGIGLMLGPEHNTRFWILNNDSGPQGFELVNNNQVNVLPVQLMDAFGKITHQDGTLQKIEFYYGSGYLSQSSRQLHTPISAKQVEFVDYAGNSRNISLNNQPQSLNSRE